jgi:hypothetical protein
VAAPATPGTFLRALTFGHVRQLDRVLAESRVVRAPAMRGDRLEHFVDVVALYLGLGLSPATIDLSVLPGGDGTGSWLSGWHRGRQHDDSGHAVGRSAVGSRG